MITFVDINLNICSLGLINNLIAGACSDEWNISTLVYFQDSNIILGFNSSIFYNFWLHMRKEFCCHPRDQTEMENNINEYEFLRKLLLLCEVSGQGYGRHDLWNLLKNGNSLYSHKRAPLPCWSFWRQRWWYGCRQCRWFLWHSWGRSCGWCTSPRPRSWSRRPPCHRQAGTCRCRGSGPHSASLGCQSSWTWLKKRD